MSGKHIRTSVGFSKFQSPCIECPVRYTTSSPSFFFRHRRASETRARVKITPREKRRHALGREKNEVLSTTAFNEIEIVVYYF